MRFNKILKNLLNYYKEDVAKIMNIYVILKIFSVHKSSQLSY